MSPSLCRLKRRSEFLRTAAAGLKWVTPGVIVQARQREADGEGPRVGYTVSKKVGNAVQRNRARRRLRAAADDVLAARGDAAFDYVLIGRKSTLDRPFDALLGDLNDAVAGIGRKVRRTDGRPESGEPGS
ncbi:MAG: ribonuclease P protein component [Rhodospirillales bacterium]